MSPDNASMSITTWGDITKAICLAFLIRGCAREIVEQHAERMRINFIEQDTGCKVTRWSPGSRRGCTPFNISNQESNTTAWLCCP
jgi:hypothetical protein